MRKQNAASDLIGKKFDKLMVLEKTEQRVDRNIVWKCRCDCGNIVYRTTKQLRDNIYNSCGCERYTRLMSNSYNDLSGRRFGLLTAIEPTEQRSPSGHIIWLCKCDCGNTHLSSSNTLLSNKVYSCGCLKESKGEFLISNLLTQAGLPFERQKTFESCRFPDTNSLARFDFYVDNRYLIEYDGEQHFSYRDHGWNTEENYNKTRMRDNYKTSWCKDNNIPLIRIPYTKLSTLSLEDVIYSG